MGVTVCSKFEKKDSLGKFNLFNQFKSGFLRIASTNDNAFI